MWLVHGEDASKAPFEDAVLAYLQEHPEGATYEQAARDIGISVGALAIALAGLKEKGMVADA